MKTSEVAARLGVYSIVHLEETIGRASPDGLAVQANTADDPDLSSRSAEDQMNKRAKSTGSQYDDTADSCSIGAAETPETLRHSQSLGIERFQIRRYLTSTSR